MPKRDYLKEKPGARSYSWWWDFVRVTVPTSLFITGWFISASDFAVKLKNPSITGYPLFTVFKQPVYNPFWYALTLVSHHILDGELRSIYFSSISALMICTALAVIFAIAWALITNILFRSRENIHGTARLAGSRDLARRGFFQKYGVVCGQRNDAVVHAERKTDTSLRLHLVKPSRLVCHAGTVNTLLLSGTGSGKGVSCIIPTHLSYRSSIISFDPKGENFEKTAGWRSTFSRVIKWCPGSFDTARFNFVAAIRDGDENAFRDADLLVSLFFTPAKAGEDSASQYFNENAKSLFTGALLHIRFSDYKNKTLAGLSNFLVNTDYSTLTTSGDGEGNADLGKEECLDMMNTRHFYTVTKLMYGRRREYYDAHGIKAGDRIPAPEIDRIVSKAAAKAMNTNVKEKATVYATINAKLRLFDDPLIANATGASDFEIEDFIESDEPISLYLVIPYSDIDRTIFVFNILINFMMKKFSEGETSHGAVRLKNELLCIFDEFRTLGYFPQIAMNMGVLRGYGVHFFIGNQSLSQLEEVYGQHHPFLNHCDCIIVGSPGDVRDSEHFSKTIGQETVHQGKVSRSGRMRIAQNTNLSFSENDFGRNLFDASDLMRLPDNQVLVLIKGMQPYIAKKAVYYEDPRFRKKLLPPPTMSQMLADIAGLPSVMRRAAAERRLHEEERERLRTMTGRNGDASMEDDGGLFVDGMPDFASVPADDGAYEFGDAMDYFIGQEGQAWKRS